MYNAPNRKSCARLTTPKTVHPHIRTADVVN